MVSNVYGYKSIVSLQNFISDAILDEAPKQMKKGDDQNKKDQKTEQEAIDETVAKCKLKVV